MSHGYTHPTRLQSTCPLYISNFIIYFKCVHVCVVVLVVEILTKKDTTKFVTTLNSLNFFINK